MNKQSVFWDLVAGVYDIFVNIINSKTHQTLRKEIDALTEPADVILECACGTGMLTEVVANKCQKVIATDFSKNMLKKAQKKCAKHSNVQFELADIQNLKFDDASFDKVIAGNVIHLLSNPKQALSELNRVCRPGGKVIIPTYINKGAGSKENIIAKIFGKFGVNFSQKFTFASYEDFFAEAGYVEVKYVVIEGKIPCSVAVISKNN